MFRQLCRTYTKNFFTRGARASQRGEGVIGHVKNGIWKYSLAKGTFVDMTLRLHDVTKAQELAKRKILEKLIAKKMANEPLVCCEYVVERWERNARKAPECQVSSIPGISNTWRVTETVDENPGQDPLRPVRRPHIHTVVHDGSGCPTCNCGDFNNFRIMCVGGAAVVGDS